MTALAGAPGKIAAGSSLPRLGSGQCLFAATLPERELFQFLIVLQCSASLPLVPCLRPLQPPPLDGTGMLPWAVAGLLFSAFIKLLQSTSCRSLIVSLLHPHILGRSGAGGAFLSGKAEFYPAAHRHCGGEKSISARAQAMGAALQFIKHPVTLQ